MPDVPTAPGTYSAVATFPGSADYTQAMSAPVMFAIARHPTTTALAASTPGAAPGQPVTFTATVAGGLPAPYSPTGSVQFQVNGANDGAPVTLDANEMARLSIAAPASGPFVVTAVYLGDADFAPSTSTATSPTVLAPGVTVVGTTLYLVGGNTSDYALIGAAGAKVDGSTGLTVDATLNNAYVFRTFAPPFAAIVIYVYNDNFQLAPSLTLPTTVVEGNGNDYLQLAGGNDTVTLGTGSDQTFGGNGNKTITASDAAGTGGYIGLGLGNETIRLGAGNDQVVLGGGTSSVIAGNGNDSVTAGDGANTITLGNGNDLVRTGTGGDTIALGSGNENIQLGDGNKTVTAQGGNNYLRVGTGTDLIAMGSGNDNVQLGNGNNTVTLGTGFRAEKLRSLTPERFSLDGNPPTATVPAGYTKNGREAVQPFPLHLAAQLRPWLATLPPGRPVFPLSDRAAGDDAGGPRSGRHPLRDRGGRRRLPLPPGGVRLEPGGVGGVGEGLPGPGAALDADADHRGLRQGEPARRRRRGGRAARPDRPARAGRAGRAAGRDGDRPGPIPDSAWTARIRRDQSWLVGR